MWKGVFIAVEGVKQGTRLGSKMSFQEKGGGGVKIYSNSSNSNLLRGQIWDKFPQNLCLEGDFCIICKMCLGYNYKMVREPNVSPHKQIIKDDDVKECISTE